MLLDFIGFLIEKEIYLKSTKFGAKLRSGPIKRPDLKMLTL